MANSPKTINSRFPWTLVLPKLGTRVATGVLPALLRCPVCKADKLRIYDDLLLGGQWAHCNSCQFAGDLIEFAAAVWKCDIEGALLRLHQRGCDAGGNALDPHEVLKYLEHHIAYRRRLNEFWRRAQQAPIQTPSQSLMHLLRQFNATESARPGTWRHHGGQLIGGAHRRDVEDLFQPDSYTVSLRANHGERSTERRGSGGGANRIFHGNGWEDLLVIPHFDLPGRICGFTFVGREANPINGDVVFKAANLGNAGDTHREAGLAFWPAIEQPPHRHLGDSVFVFTDPSIALRLQLRHLRSSSLPLPIVIGMANQRAESKHVWKQLPDRRFIFWGDTAAVLKQARETGGLVSDYRVSSAELNKNLRHQQPLNWLRLIAKHAVTWDVALRAELRSCDASGAEELLHYLDLRPEELRDFIASCAEELRDRLRGINPQRFGHRRVRVGNHTVIESEAGWHLHSSGEQISNAALRVEEVIVAASGRCFYRGIARLKGRDLEFVVNEQDVDSRGLLCSARAQLMRDGKGLLISQHNWSNRAMFIAQQLHPPELVQGVDRIGWNRERRQFLFPNFWIAMGGEVGRTRLPLRLEPNVPGEHLQEPEPLTPREAEALSADLPEVKLTWGLAATIMHNLLAPVLNYAPVGVVLDGQTADVTGRNIAQTLGCLATPLKGMTRGRSVLESINDHCQRHDWPTVLAPSGVRKAIITAEWLDEPGLRNAFLPLNWFASRSMAAQADVHVIHASGPARVCQIAPRTLAKIIPGYLHGLCERKFWIDRVGDSQLIDILHDIAGWFETQSDGASSEAVLTSREVLDPVSSVPAWSRFVDLVCMLIDEGAMAVGDVSTAGSPTGLVHRPGTGNEPGTMWISQSQLNRCLGERHALPIDIYTVYESMKAADVVVRRQELHGELGWTVSARWWNEKQSQWRALQGGRLSVVG